MELIQESILLKVDNIYEKEMVVDDNGKAKNQDVYKGFLPEGKVALSNVEGIKKGDTVLVNPFGGSEVQSMNTKKNRYLVIEKRDILLKK